LNHRIALCALAATMLFVSTVHAQDRSHHADTWNFGTQCRIKWTADASSFAFTLDPKIATGEGCASFSDPATGDLLIYTDGHTVWGPTGTVLLTGLPGDSSSMQSGVIVPVPSQPGHVYVLGHSSSSSSSIVYRRFDVTGTAVAEGTNGTVSFGSAIGREGMLVIPNKNGIDYWVLVSGASQVFVIPVTTAGVGAPVSTTANVSIWGNGWSLFTASHQGDRLVVSGNDSTAGAAGNIQMFDFDRATGTLSNQTLINPSFRRNQFYGGVFSPSGKRLYFSTLTEADGKGHFYQYDLETQTYTQLAVGNTLYTFGDGRLAPDGKIYVAGSNSPKLHVIDFPDAVGTAVSFRANAITPPAGCTIGLGLPQTPSPIVDVQLSLSVNILQPTAVVTTPTTTVSGSANAPDGATVIVTVTAPDGTEQTCNAIVTGAAWSCPADSITGLGQGPYGVTAIVTAQSSYAQDEASFCSIGAAPAGSEATICAEQCSSLVDDDLNGYVDIYDPACQPGEAPCTVPITPAAFSIKKAAETAAVYEDLFWPITADIDGDGKTEILAARQNPGRIDVLDGKTLAVKSSIAIDGDRGDVFAVANLDGDPQLEVAALIHQRPDAGPNPLANRMMVADFVNGAWVVNSSSATETAFNCLGNVGTGLGIGFADFDGDGKPEIFYGNEVWTYPADLTTGCTDCVTKTLDADRDGTPLAMHGCYVGGNGAGPQGAVSVVADVLDAADCAGSHDCDGPELIVAGNVFSVDLASSRITLQRNVNAFGAGTTFGDGFTAVADLDGDGDLDVAVAGNAPNSSTLYAYDPKHKIVLKTWTMPGTSGHGFSPITIADVFDEDLADDGNTGNSSVGNLPELIVTRLIPGGTGAMYALNVSSATPIWTQPTTDASGSTATTVFDFNGDGVLELAYRDSFQMRVMYGGPLQYAPAGVNQTDRNYASFACLSATMNEGPTVADVDDDGAAELVVLCGNGPAALTVFESAGAPWREARHVWNQPMFAPGAINEKGVIYPVAEERGAYIPLGSSQRPLNVAISQSSPLDYRGRTSGVVTAADAVVSEVHLRAEDCSGGAEVVDVVLTNAGDALITSTFPIAIDDNASEHTTDFTLADAELRAGTLPIGPGQSVTARFRVHIAGSVGVRANPGGVVPECHVDEGNAGAAETCETCGMETCNGQDDDCDGVADDGCDDDGDGYCDGALGCDPELVGAACPNGCGDCNDDDGDSNPSALEVCDGVDNDCNEQADEGCDDDQDGFCDAFFECDSELAAETCPNGCGDCNDDDDAINPGGLEVCNGQDDDCNEDVDDGVATVGDACDGDDSDACPDGVIVCGPAFANGPPNAKVLIPIVLYCDDTGPDLVESCNGQDDDCNGATDEGCDDDHDGYCDDAMGCQSEGPLTVCPKGCGDCDDSSAAALPGGVEVCDGLDNDCIGGVDNLTDRATTCGTGACTAIGFIHCTQGEDVVSCQPGSPAADDTTCNGVDDDCDSRTDEDYQVFAIDCATSCQTGGSSSCSEGHETVPECEPVEDGSPCVSNNKCASATACHAGVCQPTAIKSCDDGNPCTSDACNPLTGCVSEDLANGTPCSDGTGCTTGDTCADGVCLGEGVTCEVPRECELPGECNGATGVCDYDFIEGCIACAGDTTPPVLVCPTPITGIECAVGGAEVTLGQASARDVCSAVTITNDAPGVYEAGTTEVTYEATDAAGNSATCTTSVVISDTTPPVINCPERTEVQGDPGTCGAIVTLAPTATDDCDGTAVTFIGPAVDGAFFPPGPSTTVVAAVDHAGNQATCETIIDVVGLDDFSITCEDELTVDAPDDYCGWPDTLTAQVDDQCRTTVTIESQTDGFPVGQSDVTFQADRGDGAKTCVTHLTVNDVTPPTVDCGAAGSAADLVATLVPTAHDACGATLTIETAGCERVVDDTTTPVDERCDVSIKAGTSVQVNDAPKSEDGDIYVVYTGTVVDGSGNSAPFTCHAPVDPESLDHDHDTILDRDDNCPDVPNTNQADQNGDGIGDACQDVPYDGLEAEGSGGCEGAGGGLWLAALGLLVVMARRRVGQAS